MSYTLLVGGHNCIIAGDFIKKSIRLLSHGMYDVPFIFLICLVHNVCTIYVIHFAHS